MKHVKTFESFLNEGGAEGSKIRQELLSKPGGISEDDVVFSVDDEKLDQLLNSRFSRQLDFQKVNGDEYYVLNRKDFDRFLDLADSSGFDVDYENSEDSVIYVQESRVNEAFKDTREIVGNDMEVIIDALNFLGKSVMGRTALEKACKGKVPYTIFLQDQNGFPKPGGMHMSSIDFMPNLVSGMKVEEFIDVVNKVLADHGYDKQKVEIKK
jgi:hypothetical protein